MTAALTIADLDVRFGSFQAINGLSVEVNYGEIHAMIGPNGAGKSTLLDVVSGLTRPKAGRVLLDGRLDLLRMDQAAIARTGVRRKFQKPSVFDALTVRENVDAGVSPWFRARGSDAATAARVDEVLHIVGLEADAERFAGELAHGQKQRLEIGMVIGLDPRILMLDEPVAGLTDEETERTAELVRSLRSPERALIVVEHDMDFVEQIADCVTVLHEGRELFSGSMVDARKDNRVIEVYLGR